MIRNLVKYQLTHSCCVMIRIRLIDTFAHEIPTVIMPTTFDDLLVEVHYRSGHFDCRERRIVAHHIQITGFFRKPSFHTIFIQ